MTDSLGDLYRQVQKRRARRAWIFFAVCYAAFIAACAAVYFFHIGVPN